MRASGSKARAWLVVSHGFSEHPDRSWSCSLPQQAFQPKASRWTETDTGWGMMTPKSCHLPTLPHTGSAGPTTQRGGCYSSCASRAHPLWLEMKGSCSGYIRLASTMCQTLYWGFMNEQKQTLPNTSRFTVRVRIKFKITPLMDLTGQRRWSQEGLWWEL